MAAEKATRKKSPTRRASPPEPATKKKSAARRPERGRKRTATHRRARKGKPEGRRAFRPTDEQRNQVELLVGMGLTYKQVAVLTVNPDTGKGISTATLQRAFAGELQTGQPKVYAQVVQSLVSKAMSKTHPQAAACAMFFLKCRHGWRQEDKLVHEIEPGAVGVLIAPARVTPEEWIREQAVANAKRKPPLRNGDG